MADHFEELNWLRITKFREKRGGDKDKDEDWLFNQKVADILIEAQACLYPQ